MNRPSLNTQCLCYLKKAILFLFFTIALAGCMREKETEYSLGHEQYFFRPQRQMDLNTILKSLTSQSQEVSGRVPVSWSEKQFVDLIVALASQVPLNKARVQSVFFSVACEAVDFGPQTMSIIFWSTDVYNNQPMRLETEVAVEAQTGHIKSTQTGYEPSQPPEIEVGALDSLGTMVQAETLLASAEQMGGEKFRESISNDCRISGVLSGKEWAVFYESPTDYRKVFVVIFDAITGKTVDIRNAGVTPIPP